MGTLSPDVLSSFSSSAKLLFSQFQLLRKYGFLIRQCGREHALERSSLFKIFAPNIICTNIFNHDFISQKNLQRLGTASQRPLPNVILHSHPIITVDLSMNVNNWAHPSNHVFVSNICFKYAQKWIISSLIFQKFLRRSTELLPQTLSPFSFGLCHQFGLCSQFIGASHPLLWLRASSIIGRSAASIGASPLTFN